MPPNWYEFPLPGEFLEGIGEITVTLKRLPPSRQGSAKILPFVVGFKPGYRRGVNSYNGKTDDLCPYTEGVQKGSYKIAFKLARKEESKNTMLWWGHR